MQKVMLFLASMLIVFSLSSCSKDDESTITISPKEVTMKVDENKKLQTTSLHFYFLSQKKNDIAKK